MNKVMKIVCTMTALSAFLIPSVSSAAGFSYNLYYGLNNNASVQALQEFLTVQGDYTGPITGNFYSLTLAGVKKFQGEHAVPTTGYFGVLSRGVANNILAAQLVAPTVEEIGSSAVPAVPTTTEPVITVQEATTTDATTTDTTVTAPTGSEEVPVLLVPTCKLGANVVDSNGSISKVSFTWDMNPKAKGNLSGYGVLPTYTTYTAHPAVVSVLQYTPSVTYTLTETMTDPAYQAVTTCSVEADNI